MCIEYVGVGFRVYQWSSVTQRYISLEEMQTDTRLKEVHAQM